MKNQTTVQGLKWIPNLKKWAAAEITIINLGGTEPSVEKIIDSSPYFNVVKENFSFPEKGLVELRRIYSDYDNLSESNITDISLCAAYFGDIDFAMDAMERGIKINAMGLFKVWFPVMKEVRQLPRFKEIVREIGLVDYWKEYGWPDLCRPVGDDDFVCD